MLTHPTLDQLRQLGLAGMARAFEELAASPRGGELDHAEWLGLLLDRELADRQDRRLTGAAALCQAAPPGRRRGCRLSHPARSGPRAVPEAGPRRLDRAEAEPDHRRPDRVRVIVLTSLCYWNSNTF